MRNYVSIVLVLLLFAINGCSQERNSDAMKLGIKSAEFWLEFVDNEKYAESWEEAAEYFKSAITKEKWEKTIQAVRNPLGKVVSRKLKTQKYTTSLPGAPEGEYVVIQYNTAFENKKNSIETITPMLNNDGQWRVSGYFIK